jgi:hypothetical protein
VVESSLIDQAEGLARDLARLHAERTDVLDTVQQLAHRLRKAGIKLAISGVVGLAGLGMMVWDAFDYAATYLSGTGFECEFPDWSGSWRRSIAVCNMSRRDRGAHRQNPVRRELLMVPLHRTWYYTHDHRYTGTPT